MKHVRDTVHGFRERPHYAPSELDSLFERAATDFLIKKHGRVQFPISTDDLTTLIEQDVSDLDQYADLSIYGIGVEGVTEFVPPRLPRVAISERVHRYENRLRTTLAHEYGHVKLHSSLFSFQARQVSFGPNRKPNTIYSLQGSAVPKRKFDWMEWQARYASGACLMPRSYLSEIVKQIQRDAGIYGGVSSESVSGQRLISAVMSEFGVSREAATVRLKILRFLGTEPAIRSLFD